MFLIHDQAKEKKVNKTEEQLTNLFNRFCGFSLKVIAGSIRTMRRNNKQEQLTQARTNNYRSVRFQYPDRLTNRF